MAWHLAVCTKTFEFASFIVREGEPLLVFEDSYTRWQETHPRLKLFCVSPSLYEIIEHNFVETLLEF